MHIVVTEPEMISQELQKELGSLGSVRYGPFSNDQLLQILPDCEVLMVRLGRYVGGDIIRNAPRLRYVVSATTGLDHIDVDLLKSVGIRVVCLRDCAELIQDVSSTAEHTWGLLLSLIRFSGRAASHVLGGGWDRNLFWGKQLRGKRLGIIGYGRIGRMLADYGIAFGMEVVAFDLDTSFVQPPARFVPLYDLVQQCDVISVNVTSDLKNRHLINRDLISQFKPGAFFLNTARGYLVDSIALAETVVSGLVAGVALDVLEGEEHGSIGENHLLECARAGYNVLITPHIGGATSEAISQTEMAVVGMLKKNYIAQSKTGFKEGRIY